MKTVSLYWDRRECFSLQHKAKRISQLLNWFNSKNFKPFFVIYFNWNIIILMSVKILNYVVDIEESVIKVSTTAVTSAWVQCQHLCKALWLCAQMVLKPNMAGNRGNTGKFEKFVAKEIHLFKRNSTLGCSTQNIPMLSHIVWEEEKHRYARTPQKQHEFLACPWVQIVWHKSYTSGPSLHPITKKRILKRALPYYCPS